MRNSDNVAIFWDYENCSIPSSVSGYDVVNSIRSVARPFGSVNLFKAYSEMAETRAVSRSELQSSGVSLIDCPHNGRKDVADKMILVDMLAFAIDNPTPCTVILISGDRDFAYALSILRLRRYRVVLITLPNAHVSLTSQPSLCLDWSEIAAAEVKSSIGANFTHGTPSRCTTDCFSPPPARNNDYQDDDLVEIDTTQYVRSRIQQRNNNGAPQSPSKASTNSRIFVSNNTRGSSYAASSESEETCVNNGQRPSCSTPPNLAQRMKSPLEPTNRKPLEATFSGDWNVLSNENVAKNDHDAKLRKQASPPNLGDFDFTIPPDGTYPKRLQEHSTGVNEIFIAASAQMPPETPPRTMLEVSSPTAPLLPSALINETKLQASKRNVPVAFAFLIRRLQELRSKGQFKVFRSNLAFELTSTPSIFQRAGVTDSNQYFAMAQDFGIVRTGEDNNKPWIILCQEWFSVECNT